MLHRGWTLYSYFISFVTSTTAGAELVLPMLLVHIVTFPHTALPWGCTQPYIDISPTIFWYFTSFVTSTTTGAVLVLPVLRWFGTCSNTVLPRGWTECPAIPGRNAPLMAPLLHTAYMHTGIYICICLSTYIYRVIFSHWYPPKSSKKSPCMYTQYILLMAPLLHTAYICTGILYI